MKKKKIIFNADDLGMGKDIDRGILLAATENLIQSVSVSVINGLSKEVVSRYREHPEFEKLSVGLHLNLTEGLPLTETFKSCNSAFKLLAAEDSLDEKILYEEMKSQFEHFINLFNEVPCHIDCHQHFSFLSPKSFLAMLSLSQITGVPIRSPTPFLNATRLIPFLHSVEARFGIKLPFTFEKRVNKLNEITNHRQIHQRSDDCILDYLNISTKNLTDESGIIEVVCHPRFINGTEVSAEIDELKRLRDELFNFDQRNGFTQIS